MARPSLRQCKAAEASGALGDLGTLLPLLVALAHAKALALTPALFFAGAANLLTGLVWDLPMCVQPMKTVAAVALAENLSATQVSLAGVEVGAIVLLLALTRGIVMVNNAVPFAVIRGMQLGLGLVLAKRGLAMISEGEPAGFLLHLGGPVAGCILGSVCMSFVLLSGHYAPRTPTALILFLFGLVLAGLQVGLAHAPFDARPTLPFEWALANATAADASRALLSAALPQLPLTTLNSIVSVCALSADLFPDRPASQVSVALSVGLINLVCCPLGGMPVCHGAGGLAAQYRFGARRGVSMVLLGLAKMLVAVSLGGATLSLLDSFPRSVLGVLLVCAGLELGLAGAQKLKEQREWRIGLITAAVTLSLKTGIGCLVGLAAELLTGGGVALYRIVRRGELRSTLLAGASQPLLARYDHASRDKLPAVPGGEGCDSVVAATPAAGGSSTTEADLTSAP